MALFRRRAVTTRPAIGALAPGEGLLAWAPTSGGTVLCATTHRLVAVRPDGTASADRPWHAVDTASWDAPSRTMSLVWVQTEAADSAWAFAQEPGLLLQAVRERVQASVVVAQEVRLARRVTARVVIRRDLATGELLDQVVLDQMSAYHDPAVRSRIDQARVLLREQVGL